MRALLQRMRASVQPVVPRLASLLGLLPQGWGFLAWTAVMVVAALALHIAWQRTTNEATAFWGAVAFAAAFCSLGVWFTMGHIKHAMSSLPPLVAGEVQARIQLIAARRVAWRRRRRDA
jgi:xanthine/uracil permease